MKKLLYVPYEFVGPMALNSKALPTNSPNWIEPGTCFSTSVHVFPANMGSFLPVHNARMRLAWTGYPGDQANSNQPPVVRLVTADSGPKNRLGFGPWLNPSALNSPVGSGVDVTAVLQELLDDGVWKQIVIQTAGNMVINRATLEVYWEIDALAEDEVGALIDAKTEALEARIAALEATGV